MKQSREAGVRWKRAASGETAVSSADTEQIEYLNHTKFDPVGLPLISQLHRDRGS